MLCRKKRKSTAKYFYVKHARLDTFSWIGKHHQQHFVIIFFSMLIKYNEKKEIKRQQQNLRVTSKIEILFITKPILFHSYSDFFFSSFTEEEKEDKTETQ